MTGVAVMPVVQAQEDGLIFLVLTPAIDDVEETVIEETVAVLESRLAALEVETAGVSYSAAGDQWYIFVVAEGFSTKTLVTTLTAMGLLEFVDVNPYGTEISDGDCIVTSYQEENELDDLLCDTPVQLPDAPETIMTNTGIDDAAAVFDNVRWHVSFVLTDEGSDIFEDFTASHIGQNLAIVMDGEILSNPSIQAQITGQGVVTGQFTEAEAQVLAAQFRSGRLPVPLDVMVITGASEQAISR